MISKYVLPGLAALTLLALTPLNVAADEVDDLFSQLRKEVETQLKASKEEQARQQAEQRMELSKLMTESVKKGMEEAGKTNASSDELALKIITKLQVDLVQQIPTVMASSYSRSEGQTNPALYSHYLTAAHGSYKSGRLMEARQQLDTLAATITTEQALDVLGKLKTALELQIEKQKQERAAQSLALIREKSAALLKAEKPTDLDSIILDLSAAAATAREDQRYGRDSRVDMEQAINMVECWQDYLMYRDSNNQQAIQALETLLSRSNVYVAELLPRSLILEKKVELVGPVAKKPVQGNEAQLLFEKALAETKTPDQIPALRQKIVEFGYNNSFRSDIQSLETAYSALQKKQYDRALANSVEAYRKPDYEHLAEQIIVACLPSYLEAPETTSLAEGESVSAVIDRLNAEAAKADRWSAVYRGLSLKRALRRNSDSRDVTLDYDVAAVGALLSGYNFARAGENVRAVRSYQSALENGRTIDVTPFVGPQLQKIRETHPDDYEKATQPITRDSSSGMDTRVRRQNPENESVPTKLPPGPLKEETPASTPSKDAQSNREIRSNPPGPEVKGESKPFLVP